MKYQDISKALRNAKAQIGIFGALFLIGIAITILSMMSEDSSGYYIICSGMIIFGGAGFFRAMIASARLSATSTKIYRKIIKQRQCADELAMANGYRDFVDMEENESKRLGFQICNSNDHIERFDGFAKQYGYESFEQLYDDFLRTKSPLTKLGNK